MAEGYWGDLDRDLSTQFMTVDEGRDLVLDRVRQSNKNIEWIIKHEGDLDKYMKTFKTHT